MLNIEMLVRSRIDDLRREAEEIRLARSVLVMSGEPTGLKRAIWLTGRWLSTFGRSMQQQTANPSHAIALTKEPKPCKSC